MNREEVEEDDRIRLSKGWIITGILILLIITALFFLNTRFNIESIQVVGNIHYTDDEIIEMVVGEGYNQNTLVMYVKNKLMPMRDIPFVQKVDVEYVSNHEITLTVYEKSIAGCVQFMNEYMYFDKDGIVLESTQDRLEDIPCIEGIHFDTMVIHEALPIEDSSFFYTVLTLTQLIQKYDLPVENVRFTSQNEIVMYSNGIQILLGDGSHVDEQLSELKNILQSVDDRHGTLYMKDYSIADGNVIFRDNP